jgi:[ribosomal protein S5]-alanine N-acetyltransferase
MLRIKELEQKDMKHFIFVMQESKDHHYPFIDAPKTKESFLQYLADCSQENRKSFLTLDGDNIVGSFTISEMVRGCFQSGYLGYCVNTRYAGKGWMSKSLELVLEKIFIDLGLHRIEANIQPTNTASIRLVERNGFTKEGFSPRYLKINNQWCDHFRYALTYEDWIAMQ